MIFTSVLVLMVRFMRDWVTFNKEELKLDIIIV